MIAQYEILEHYNARLGLSILSVAFLIFGCLCQF
jgi:hypothetical protein